MNSRPGVIEMTVHTAGGIRGCRTRARLPIVNGRSRCQRRTCVTDGVHSGQRSTSLMTVQATSTGASMSIVIWKSMTLLPRMCGQGGEGGRMQALLNRLAARARYRHPWLFLLVLGAGLVGPLARRATDSPPSPEAALQDRAVESIRAVQHGEGIYRAVHGYYDRLECVIQDSCAAINPYPPTYLDARLAWAVRFGYRFRFHDGDRATTGRDEWVSPTGVMAYAMTAVPERRDAGLPELVETEGRAQVDLGKCKRARASLRLDAPSQEEFGLVRRIEPKLH